MCLNRKISGLRMIGGVLGTDRSRHIKKGSEDGFDGKIVDLGRERICR